MSDLIAALVVVAAVALLANLLGWLSIQDLRPERPFNWRALLGPFVYGPWNERRMAPPTPHSTPLDAQARMMADHTTRRGWLPLPVSKRRREARFREYRRALEGDPAPARVSTDTGEPRQAP